jgi:hypothetical protein
VKEADHQSDEHRAMYEGGFSEKVIFEMGPGGCIGVHEEACYK